MKHIRFQQLLVRLQKEIIDAIEKNEQLNKRLKKLLELPCDCEKDYSTGWSFPIICTILYPIIYFLGMSAIILALLNKILLASFIWHLYEIIFLISYKLNCSYIQF